MKAVLCGRVHPSAAVTLPEIDAGCLARRSRPLAAWRSRAFPIIYRCNDSSPGAVVAFGFDAILSAMLLPLKLHSLDVPSYCSVLWKQGRTIHQSPCLVAAFICDGIDVNSLAPVHRRRAQWWSGWRVFR